MMQPMVDEEAMKAQEVALWNMLQGVEVDDGMTVQFYMSCPDFIEEDDQIMAKRIGFSFFRNATIGIIAGLICNVQMKRIPKINFLHWNRLLRYLVRIPVFFAPFALIFGKETEKQAHTIFAMRNKYMQRLKRFQRSGSMKAFYSPAIVAQSQKRMQEMGMMPGMFGKQ
jgi:hypothetical protein